MHSDAASKLLDSLKAPQHHTTPNEKLMHNRKVFHYYLEANPNNRAGLNEKKLSPKPGLVQQLPQASLYGKCLERYKGLSMNDESLRKAKAFKAVAKTPRATPRNIAMAPPKTAAKI